MKHFQILQNLKSSRHRKKNCVKSFRTQTKTCTKPLQRFTTKEQAAKTNKKRCGNISKMTLRTCQNYPESKQGQYRFKKYSKSVTSFPHGKRQRKCSKSAKNDTDNIRKSSQMANGVRVGHPAALLGRVFVPRVARLKQTRRSQARLWPKIVHSWDLRAVIFRRKRENGWPRTHPKIRLWKRNEKDDKTVKKWCQNGGRNHGFGICVCGSLNLAKLLYL